MRLLNWDLIANPYNWVVVFLMCAFAMAGLSLVFPPLNEQD